MEGKGIKVLNRLGSSADIHLNTVFIKRVLDPKGICRLS